MDISGEPISSKPRWTARQPLLFGLAAVGGLGLYSVVQTAGEPQDDDKAPKLVNPPSVPAPEPAPAPDFGPVAAAAESRVGGLAVSQIKPAYPAKVSFAAVAARSAVARERQAAQPLVMSAVTRTHSALRHTGSFVVPTREEADFASNAGLAMPQLTQATEQAAALIVPQPVLQAATITAPSVSALSAQLENLGEAQQSFTPADQTASATMLVTQPETEQPQTSPRSLLPEVPSGADSGTAPSEPSAAPPIVRAGSTSRLAAPQLQAAQPGTTARAAAVKPENSLALALPGSKLGPGSKSGPPGSNSGIEGLVGLDDSQLAGVRPILGETRQQAASAKRRGSGSGVVRPSARRQTAEEATPNPDKISAAGSLRDVHVPARINNSLIGNLPLQIAADGAISARLGDLLALVEGRMDQQMFKGLQLSSAANSQVSLTMLRNAGMRLRYEPVRNQVVLEVGRA